ncbi:tRNA pseudouridine(38-40) synthase TruA [Jiulongibacter sediminis]|jgi:tRNA pseudouridine38-40 synthase|uniref:tRNA pseudouridine(38-40) synthase TruA n=1 Tax=Jiulongibacter sediminis TaxID=1605367 RepID=UPI0026ED3DFE|nr:tRNA pseudouridine(38-40) synthase TruA [Jiulongibacter sediminis]
MRYFVELSYLGTVYHGWQLQPNAVSIQEKLEDAFSKILRKEIRIHGSSRTDTGVHARQQYAYFDVEDIGMSFKDLVWKLNSFLPEDISINEIIPLADEAHARFDALSRKYIYRIHLKKDPFLISNSLFFRKPLDLEKMNEAAQILFEYEDFECFSKVKTDVNTFNCTIEEAHWVQNDHQLEFHIKANRFLRGMVRAIVGTLLDIGEGKMDINDLRSIIESKKRTRAGRSIEAIGLTLEEVNYPDNYFNGKKS